MRVLGPLLAIAATLVAFSAAAFAQTPTPTATAAQETPTAEPTVTATPTPTVTPTPTPDPAEQKKARLRKRLVVKRVYRDYRQDGKIDNCQHSRKALKRTLESISDTFDADFPDFREAVKAAIKDWDKKRCAAQAAQPTPTATPVPTSTPAPAPTTAPPPPPPPPTSPGSLAPPTKTPKPSKTPKPPSESDITPPAATATATPTPTPTPPAEAQLVVTRPHPEDANLTVPLVLLLAALLGLLAAGGTAIYARRTGHLAGWGHAWREAGYRATGAWGDFSDWLRLGR
jgi:hypothetical protein